MGHKSGKTNSGIARQRYSNATEIVNNVNFSVSQHSVETQSGKDVKCYYVKRLYGINIT